MMASGNPNWWNVHPPSMFSSSQFVQLAGSPSVSLNSLTADAHDQNTQSWSQMLLTGLPIDQDERTVSHFETKKFENWDDQILNNQASARSSSVLPFLDGIKQEVSHHSNNINGILYGRHGQQEFQAASAGTAWSQQQHSNIMPVSSPRSCVTSLSHNNNNMLDFTYNTNNNNVNVNENADTDRRNHLPDHHASSECNSTTNTAVSKKARVQSSSSQPPLKVRKEKLGDRITALHQLVSPFGKTDTASVLLEAIGYIRFLQSQIEALSLPYFGNVSKNMRNHHQTANCEMSCVFPEDPGQLLNDTCLKRKGTPNQDIHDNPKDLRSRGLCLVPISCTQNVGSDNGADYWAPAYGGGF